MESMTATSVWNQLLSAIGQAVAEQFSGQLSAAGINAPRFSNYFIEKRGASFAQTIAASVVQEFCLMGCLF